MNAPDDDLIKALKERIHRCKLAKEDARTEYDHGRILLSVRNNLLAEYDRQIAEAEDEIRRLQTDMSSRASGSPENQGQELRDHSKAMAKFRIIRSFWLRTQLMRVIVRVNPGHSWELEGLPANSPQENDEMLESQVQLLEEYQKLGLYDVHRFDRIRGIADGVFGVLLNSNRGRQPWKRSGIFDQNGKAIEIS